MHTLSIIIPTAGRRSIEQTFQSLRAQLGPNDQVIVVGDTLDSDCTWTRDRCRELGFFFFSHNTGVHDWGHSQINFGMSVATKDFLVFQDDDDIFTPGALDRIRESLVAGQPLIARFRTHYDWIVGDHMKQGHIGGHCIVAPNDKSKLGSWSARYEGDFDFIESTMKHYSTHTKIPSVIATARPLLTWRSPMSPEDYEWLRTLRNEVRHWMTENTNPITVEDQLGWAARTPVNNIFIFETALSGRVGAGLWFQRDGSWWITLMVDPKHQGQGLGTEIYRYLSFAAPTPMRAKIRPDNLASSKAARRAGLREIEPGLWEVPA